MKKKKFNEDMLDTILCEAKEAYNRNSSNSDKLDTKIVQLFTLSSAILIIFVQFIAIPTQFGATFLYVTCLLIFVGVLLTLIIAYNPKMYAALDVNVMINKYYVNRKFTKVDLLQAIAGTLASSTNDVKTVNQKKSRLIKIAAYLLVSCLVLMFILKFVQGV